MSTKSYLDERKSALKFLMRALAYKNYRLFFGGQSLSLIGTWMQQIAMSWLVYRMTDSAFLLGLIGFTGQVPTVIFGSFAGVYADRLNRRNLLIATQAFSMIQALLLAFLALIGLGRIITFSTCILGCGLIAFSFSRYLPLSLLMMLLTGFGMIVSTASCNTIVQTIVDEDKRGRVMSFYAIAFIGMAPFGSLIGGSIAHNVGAPLTLAGCGFLSIVCAVFFNYQLPLIRKSVRPIYFRMGIIQEMPTELQ